MIKGDKSSPYSRLGMNAIHSWNLNISDGEIIDTKMQNNKVSKITEGTSE